MLLLSTAGELTVQYSLTLAFTITILTKLDLKYDNCNVPSEWNDSGVRKRCNPNFLQSFH